MRTFVMGDIHGAHKALVQCLERSGFDIWEDRLIQLGDVADGWPEVFECVETLLTIEKLVAIKGNHDQWLETFITQGYHPAHFAQGGLATAVSYMRKAGLGKRNYISTGYGYKVALTKHDIPFEHRKFFTTQRLYYIDDQQRCFVHGGFNPRLLFVHQKPETFYWNRVLWEDAVVRELKEKEGGFNEPWFIAESFTGIFLGHTATTQWHTDQPMFASGLINLDTGAGHNGRLTIMDADTKAYWQSDPVKDLYPGIRTI